jgi:hypothetical protein
MEDEPTTRKTDTMEPCVASIFALIAFAHLTLD